MVAKTIKDCIDCREVVEELLGPPVHRYGRAWHWSCPFHADGKTPSLAVWPDGWKCFGCGKKGDAPGFLMQRLGISFPEALQRLGISSSAQLQKKRQDNLAGWFELPPEEWQTSTSEEVRAANCLLVVNAALCRATKDNSEYKSIVYDYLRERGIESAACAPWYWCLGETRAFDPATGREHYAVVIPHFDGDGETLLAVKYRLIGAQTRYIAKPGSKIMGVYGLHLCRPGPSRRLMVVEGELNAVSLWQYLRFENWDVVSVVNGFPSKSTLEVLQALARMYDRVVVWIDEEESALKVAQELGARAVIRSPKVNGKKFDANAILQRGLLKEFLQETLGIQGKPHNAIARPLLSPSRSWSLPKAASVAKTTAEKIYQLFNSQGGIRLDLAELENLHRSLSSFLFGRKKEAQAALGEAELDKIIDLAANVGRIVDPESGRERLILFTDTQFSDGFLPIVMRLVPTLHGKECAACKFYNRKEERCKFLNERMKPSTPACKAMNFETGGLRANVLAQMSGKLELQRDGICSLGCCGWTLADLALYRAIRKIWRHIPKSKVYAMIHLLTMDSAWIQYVARVLGIYSVPKEEVELVCNRLASVSSKEERLNVILELMTNVQ